MHRAVWHEWIEPAEPPEPARQGLFGRRKAVDGRDERGERSGQGERDRRGERSGRGERGGSKKGGGLRVPGWGTLAVALLLGLALMRHGLGDDGPPQPASAAGERSGGSGAVAWPQGPPPEPLNRALPERITIPFLDVDAPVGKVGLGADDWIGAPPLADNNLAAWYDGSVTPGESGTSVLVGHVDNKAGPAVFYGLGALTKGRRIEIARTDGTTAVFSVYAVEVVSKSAFPADRVYANTSDPELRVLTCGGGFSRKAGYEGNVVAYARLTSVLKEG
ncbi:class F sortase [Streptomyces sp. NPDC048332]|uniref:class F sortase n=1 Tax=Streptomyces sp. NPDC048332 TaxID=3154619 RepID=UPI00343B9869